jgi:putative transposase
MMTTERFISGLAKVYRKHPVSIDGGTWYSQV